MARTLIAAQVPLGAYPVTPLTALSADLIETAADVANGNTTPLVNGKTFIVAHNTGVGARTITFTSVVDANNRKGDITAYSIGAGLISIFGPFKAAGWATSGNLLIDGSHAEVKIGVITLPA